MSQETLDLVLHAVRATIRQPKPDFETMNALFHPDHRFVPTTVRELGEAEAAGARGWKDWQEETAAVLPYVAVLQGAVDVAPDQVLVVTTNRFHGSASGLEVERRIWFLVTVAGGKIVRTEAFSDPADALEAVGLSE